MRLELNQTLIFYSQVAADLGLVRVCDLNWRPSFWSVPEEEARQEILK